MSEEISAQNNGTEDPFKLYASPKGARILREANEIFEDLPTSKYLIYIIIFTIEIIIVFWLGLHLIG
jgi:hypothetical protein